jgi:hypothetical protein
MFTSAKREHTNETGNRNFRDMLSDWDEHVERNGAAQIEETATQLAGDWETQLNSQATVQANVLTVALQRSFLISAVVTCFHD